MLSFLNAPVTRPESEVAKNFFSESLEFIAWRHRTFSEVVTVALMECVLLVGMEVGLIWLAARMMPVMQSPGARAGGGGLLGLIMALAVVGLVFTGWRVWYNIRLVWRLNVESAALEERLGDDE
jgi:hypothetical protein